MALEAGDTVKRDLFLSIGLNPKNVTSTLRNEKLTNSLTQVIEEANVDGCDKAIGNLLYKIAVKFPTTSEFLREQRHVLCRYVVDKGIHSETQLGAALKYFKDKEAFNREEFEDACGVGVDISQEEIEKFVSDLIGRNKAGLLEQKYTFNMGRLFGEVRKSLKWADGKLCKTVIDAQILELLGPKTKQNSKKTSKPKPPKQPDEKENTEDTEDGVSMDIYLTSREMEINKNTEEQIKRHEEETEGKFMTRFPPEPNGFLHIGHAKACNFNFGLARRKGGHCYLRYDDTNPTVEKDVYITNIEENVRWLGNEPWKVTFSSDYFQELCDLAVQMIKDGNAYVCHQTQPEIKASRDKRQRVASPYRERSVETNLTLFERMKNGYYAEGDATLRVKGDLDHANPNMWDQVAYRVMFSPHPHPAAGDKWCIYPSYDFTHCIVDSLENIDASCCTLEFENRRESYFWLLDVLNLYKPHVWEYSRLNIKYNVLSKRRLIKLVQDYVNGWDDPRLLTINGLRRRGIPADAINDFCNKVGVTRSSNWIHPDLLEYCTRQFLDGVAPRGMVVLDPIKVIIQNYDETKVENVSCRDFPQDETKGSHLEPFSRIVYIDRDDFRFQDSKDYYGLAPGKTVRLKYAYDIKCEKVNTDKQKNVTSIIAIADLSSLDAPPRKKGILHWVAQPSPGVEPERVEVRLYDHLFTNEFPGSKEEMKEEEEHGEEDEVEEEEVGNEVPRWVKDINPNSLTTVSNAFASTFITERAKNWKSTCEACAFQFERLGYFCKDPDSAKNHLVFNRTVTLKAKKIKF